MHLYLIHVQSRWTCSSYLRFQQHWNSWPTFLQFPCLGFPLISGYTSSNSLLGFPSSTWLLSVVCPILRTILFVHDFRTYSKLPPHLGFKILHNLSSAFLFTAFVMPSQNTPFLLHVECLVTCCPHSASSHYWNLAQQFFPWMPKFPPSKPS